MDLGMIKVVLVNTCTKILKLKNRLLNNSKIQVENFSTIDEAVSYLNSQLDDDAMMYLCVSIDNIEECKEGIKKIMSMKKNLKIITIGDDFSAEDINMLHSLGISKYFVSRRTSVDTLYSVIKTELDKIELN